MLKTVREVRTLVRRSRQLSYLASHPIGHLGCAAMVRESGIAGGRQSPMRYLGDYLALSLKTAERRQAMTGHYERISKLLPPSTLADLGGGILLWQKDADHVPALSLYLEPAAFAPMEGEMQVRFAFRSDLFVLTFLLAPGEIFGVNADTIIFIGGVQGRFYSREEMREAAKLNGEIAPATMLIIAIRAIAKVLGIADLLAVGGADTCATAHSSHKIRLDYEWFWTEAGGRRRGLYYSLPLESPQKPLSEVATHRSRARRKREAKEAIRAAIETRLMGLMAR